ncbi:GIY-YIG nuclease family protein [Methylicorpusculum sp.]|uniref:GIY-YIG nuclease family protein n=1 Tax=Methylicorpusculum sp. TaxID=2713644 RepID=UPI002AC973A9|nr:GIY-YIG nuclease family protein [Methylicorpusculum sp.]
MMAWQVYIIHCSDDSFYTGCTNDVERRYRQHAEGLGAKYFFGRKPVRLMYLETLADRSAACKIEAMLKKLKRAEKLQLISSEINEMAGSEC